jgi:hypothetical protein
MDTNRPETQVELSTPQQPEAGAASSEVTTEPAETVAQSYVLSELDKARQALQRTQIFTLVAVLAFGIYFGYITVTFRSSLEPANAAEIASGIVQDKVETGSQDLAQQMKDRIPALIAGLPDQAMEKIPVFRKTLEDRVEADFSSACKEHSQELGKNLDAFLDLHKTDVKDMLTAGQDKANMEKIGDALEVEMTAFLKQKSEGGASVMDKIDESLKAFKTVQAKSHRLATAKDLTPGEKKLRHAIAVVTATADKETNSLIKQFGKSPVEAVLPAAKNIETTSPTTS